jgi:Ran GTPase-activating protein (RanGAP) involved in mRNA processing and transport
LDHQYFTQTLTTLNLADNGIDAEGTKHLAKALENNNVRLTLFLSLLLHHHYLIQTLITLDLSNNQIGIEGAQHLAKTLENNNVNSSPFSVSFVYIISI